MVVEKVNRHDSVLFEESFYGLMEMVENLGLDIENSYFTLDPAFDNVATRSEILFQGMIPVIKPNLGALKDQERINEKLDEFDKVEHIYKERVIVERLFAWEDSYRKLAIRYEKLQSTHDGFKFLAYSMINFRNVFH